MAMEHKIMFCLVLVLALMTADKSFTEAQIIKPPSCALALQSCLPFLNSTKPPSSCCTPLKKVMENELPCICAIYNTPGVLESVGLNSTNANQLTQHCNIDSSFDDCKNALAPPPSQMDTPTSTSPSGTPGGDNGGSSKVAYTRMASFVLMCWASVLMLY